MKEFAGMEDAERRSEALKAQFGVKRLLGVFGASATDSEELHTLGVSAQMLDALVSALSQDDVALLNGGYLGTMGNLARRVIERSGTAVGIASHTIDDPLQEQNYTKIIVHEDHWQRLSLLIEAADGFIILPGGIGTLTEIATALWVMDRRLCRRKPLLFLGDYWEEIITASVELPLIFRSSDRPNMVFINDPHELRAILDELIRPLRDSNRPINESGPA